MVRSFFKNFYLLIVLVVSYIVWKAIRYAFENLEALIPIWEGANAWLGDIMVGLSHWIFNNVMGMNSYVMGRNIFMAKDNGFYVGDHCLGIPATMVFLLCIAFYKGSWKNKIWFIPIGVLGIFVLNLIRILILGLLIQYSTKAFFDFNHEITFLAVVYGFIFGIMLWWDKKFAKSKAV